MKIRGKLISLGILAILLLGCSPQNPPYYLRGSTYEDEHLTIVFDTEIVESNLVKTTFSLTKNNEETTTLVYTNIGTATETAQAQSVLINEEEIPFSVVYNSETLSNEINVPLTLSQFTLTIIYDISEWTYEAKSSLPYSGELLFNSGTDYRISVGELAFAL